MTAAGPAVLSSARCPRATRSTGRPQRCGPLCWASPSRPSRRRASSACDRRSVPSSSASRARASTSRSASTTASCCTPTCGCPARGTSTEPGEQWRKSARQARVIIEVPGWQAVCFSAPVVRTYRAKEFLPNPRLANLGPDLCQPDPDLDECLARIDRLVEPETTVAEVLLDQRIASRRRERLQVRGALALRAAPLHPDRCPAPRAAPRAAGRGRSPAALQPRPAEPDHRARRPRRCGRLRPPCQAVSPLRHAHRGRQARRAGPRHLLVPGVPAVPSLGAPGGRGERARRLRHRRRTPTGTPTGPRPATDRVDDEPWWPAEPEPLDAPAASWDGRDGTDDLLVEARAAPGASARS